MSPLKVKLEIQQGRTFRYPVRWESEVFGYAAISAIAKQAPCRVTTLAAHNLPDKWRAAVVSAGGMVEVNAVSNPPADDEWRIATVVSATQIEFNDLSSADFTTYTSGGYLQYRIPVDLTGFTARMSIKDKTGALLKTLTTENGGISISQGNKVIELFISATDTAAITWKSGLFDLELISPSLEVTALLKGGVSVLQEVTT